MLTSTAYEYRGNFICSECITRIITKDKPWSTWLAVNSPDKYPAQVALDSIATTLGINPRDEAAVKASGFPIEQSQLPDPPSFCVSCLRWFDPPDVRRK